MIHFYAIALLLVSGAILLAIHQARDFIMSQISEFSDAVNASFATIRSGLTGLSGDVQHLKDEIAKLTPSPEDTALLDAIKVEAQTLADNISALDAATSPPTPPVE
jgi:prophage DNA circulation protein